MERQTLKRAALLALEESRRELGGEILRMRRAWNPRAFVRQSLARHKIALAVAAGLLGLAAYRFFTAPRRGAGPEKGWGGGLRGKLAGLAATSLWSVFHEPILDFAKTQFASYLDKHHQSPDSDKTA
ncbi:MAG TPA: hypothetical protein VGH65_03665 [Verrucomicrobiaceae bacterium]|jgi:hypothetical protein